MAKQRMVSSNKEKKRKKDQKLPRERVTLMKILVFEVRDSRHYGVYL